ncbi:MAG TPA: hypothetical protein VHI52_02430, partial [Verrucomicrobiae bacterium]|nr:hypothetical protein [Verrucomicrobiae bacterium]
MKLKANNVRNFGLAAALCCGQLVGAVVWGKPSIRSVAVNPDPLQVGRSFTLSITASPDATAVFAAVDFRPGSLPTIDIPLTQNGQTWTGIGMVPSGVNLRPHKDEAKVKVVVLDA